jgi:hypothetical protein
VPWLKLDDGMGEHRKTLRLIKRGKSGQGLMAFGLHGLALLHCAKYLTDGVIDREFVDDTLDDAGVTGKARAAMVVQLVERGQWEVHGDGWYAHDYLEHNPSRAEVEADRGSGKLLKELSRDQSLVNAIRNRDGNRCRHCGVEVNWKDRRGATGGTYRHIVAPTEGGQNTFENVVVCCRGCSQRDPAPELPGSSPRSTPEPDRGGQVNQAPVSTSRPDPARPDPLPAQPVHQSAAAREHAPEILKIETTLGQIGQRLDLIAPTADEIADMVADHPQKDPADAVAELRRWAAKTKRADRPRTLPGAFLHCLGGATDRPPSSLPISFTAPAPADVACWEATRTQLRARVSESAFDVWLEGLTLAGVNDGTLVLTGPKDVVDWVSQRYAIHIAEAAGCPVRITAQNVTEEVAA